MNSKLTSRLIAPDPVPGIDVAVACVAAGTLPGSIGVLPALAETRAIGISPGERSQQCQPRRKGTYEIIYLYIYMSIYYR